MRKRFILASLTVGLAVACGASQPKKEAQPPRLEEVNIDAVETGALPKCTDESGGPRECMGDSDCCDGFYCGIDPEGSSRIRTCLLAQ
jgi:hypothetical protein